MKKALSDAITDAELELKNINCDNFDLKEKNIKLLESHLAELERKEVSQWEKYSEEGMPKEIFEKLNRKVKQEQDETRKAIEQARAELPQRENVQEKIKKISDALNALNNDENALEINKMLKSCLISIEYSRDRPTRDGGIKGWKATPLELSFKFKF